MDLYPNYNFIISFLQRKDYTTDEANLIYDNYGFFPTLTAEIEFVQFKTISGLESKIEVLEYNEGGRESGYLSFPGQRTYSPITMERGVGSSHFLYSWAKSFDKYDIRYDVKIVLNPRCKHETFYRSSIETNDYYSPSVPILGKKSHPARIWLLRNTWISDYKIDDLDAMANEILVESITLQYEEFSEHRELDRIEDSFRQEESSFSYA